MKNQGLRIIKIGMIWNFLYLFIYIAGISKWTLPQDPWSDHFLFAGACAIGSTAIGVVLYGVPLHIFLYYRKPVYFALFYVVFISITLVFILALFLLPGILATLSLTVSENHYTVTQIQRMFWESLLELIIGSIIYTLSYFGYAWIYWQTTHKRISETNDNGK